MTIVKKFSEIADFLLQLWPFSYNNRGQHHIKSFYFNLKSSMDCKLKRWFYWEEILFLPDDRDRLRAFMHYFHALILFMTRLCMIILTISLFLHRLIWRSFEDNYNWFHPNSINPPNILRSVRRTVAFKSETSLK